MTESSELTCLICYSTPLVLCELDCHLNRDDNIKHSVCFDCAPRLFVTNRSYSGGRCPFCRHQISESVLTQHLLYRLFNEAMAIFTARYHSESFNRDIATFCLMIYVLWILGLFRHFLFMVLIAMLIVVRARYVGYQTVDELLRDANEWTEEQRQFQEESMRAERVREREREQRMERLRQIALQRRLEEEEQERRRELERRLHERMAMKRERQKESGGRRRTDITTMSSNQRDGVRRQSKQNRRRQRAAKRKRNDRNLR